MKKRETPPSKVTLSDDGRVVLSDSELEMLVQDLGLAGAGDNRSSNGHCTNDGGCGGSLNTSNCTNSGTCSGTNQATCDGVNVGSCGGVQPH